MFEVWLWTQIGWLSREKKEYGYVQKYAGEDFDEAIKIMKKLKADSIGCVKFEWR